MLMAAQAVLHLVRGEPAAGNGRDGMGGMAVRAERDFALLLLLKEVGMDGFFPDLFILVALPADQSGLYPELVLAPEPSDGVMILGKILMTCRTGEGMMNRGPEFLRVNIGFYGFPVLEFFDHPPLGMTLQAFPGILYACSIFCRDPVPCEEHHAQEEHHEG